MQRHWLSVLVFILWVAGSLGRMHAQPEDCYPLGTSLVESRECTIAKKWSVDIDLDGDHTPDFRQVRWEAFELCVSRGGFTETQRDQAEALFAVNGVEVNMIVWPWESGALVALQFGQAILPTPDPNPPDGLRRTWIKPQDSPLLSTLGLGYADRMSNYSPCPSSACWSFSGEGILSWTNQVYVGFRIPKGNQWHLGWLRLEGEPWSERPVTLVDYAVHPEPDTMIRTGEHPRPALTVLRAGDGIRVSWPAFWTGYALESNRALGGGWAPVPGVTNNAVTLPATDAPWYFRLRR